MAHFSENSRRLALKTITLYTLEELKQLSVEESDVTLFWFPWGRTAGNSVRSAADFPQIAEYCSKLENSSTVCFFADSSDAAFLLPYLEQSLHFRLWVAVKTVSDAAEAQTTFLPKRHASLVVLTRYKTALRHTPVRIKYTRCPACGKTTKDYGGKKHIYHSDGTLMSDVWTDIECDPRQDINVVTSRLRDLFGLEPYKRLVLIDLRESRELIGAVVNRMNSHRPRTKAIQAAAPVAVRSRLINRDCIEALRTLRSDSVDFCFVDMPYNLKKKYYRCKDALGPDEYFAWCEEWMSELHRVLKPGRTLAVLNVPRWAAKHFSFLSTTMEFQDWIVWDALGLPARKIMPAHYAILCFSKGKPRLLPGLRLGKDNEREAEYLRHRRAFYCIRRTCVSRRRLVKEVDHSALQNIWSDIHRLTHNSRRVNHPCQLPPPLIRRLLALFTMQGEVILDCFNGAGTSTLVAHQMSRKFVGIEISTRYHKLALKRHRLIDGGNDPFGKSDLVPSAKNSPVLRLPKQKYRVTKKTLQLEVKRIARKLGRLPKRDDVQGLSNFPMKYFDSYFSGWGEVCAAARADTLKAART